MDHLLLSAVFCSCIVAIAGETANICIKPNRGNLPSRRVVLDCRNNDSVFDLVDRAVWTRDGKAFTSISQPSFDTSRMAINDNGTMTIDPALPRDEGEYRCGNSYENLGGKFNFTVPPYAPKEFHQAFGHLGSNFTIPCHVKIGQISRQQGFIVDWIRRTEKPTGQPLELLISYKSEADTNELIMSSHDSSYVFNSTDLSLLVQNFSVPDVNRKEIYYTCKVIAGPKGQQEASATTNVTTQFTPIKIITDLPRFIITRPGELITPSFVYRGAPVLDRVLSLDGNNLTKSDSFFRKLKFRREPQSDNTTKIFLEIRDPMENNSGLLKITIKGVNSTASTETHLIIIPQIRDLKLTPTTGERLCGDLTLSFELAKPIPSLEINVQVKVRFNEVLPLSMAGSLGRTVDETYPLESIDTLDGSPNTEGYSTVNINLRDRLPNEVAEFERYKLEAHLVVNGMDGQFTPPIGPILRDCEAPLERATLRLAVQFGGGSSCLEVKDALESFSRAIQTAIREHCMSVCDDLTFGPPELTCSANNTTGNFSAEVTAFEARAVVADFYQATQQPVPIGNDNVTITQCPTCDAQSTTESPTDESNLMRYIIIGLVVVIAVLVLLVLFLILAVLKKKKKSPSFCSCYAKNKDPENPGNFELRPPVIQVAPEPPPRSPISLTLPPDIRSRAEQTRANPTPNGKRMHSTTLPLQNGDPTLHVAAFPPHATQLPSLQLCEAATLARTLEYCHSPSTYQSSDTSSAYYIRPDGQSQCSLTPHSSPMTTPPASPSHAATASAQEVNPSGCVCQFGHSPTPPRAYKYIYTPPAKPVASHQSPHHCISLSNLTHQPQTIFQFPPVNSDVMPCSHCSCACVRTKVVRSCTCQRCRSNPELHAQKPGGEYITVDQLRGHAAVLTSENTEESGNPSHRQAVSAAVHQTPVCPSSLPKDRRGYILKTADFTRHATPSTSQLKPDSTGYVPHTMLPLPSKIPDIQCTVVPPATHPQGRPVTEGYVTCPMQATPPGTSQPSRRPVRPGYVENIVAQLPLSENIVYGPSSPAERTSGRSASAAGTHLEHSQRNVASSALGRVELPQDVSDGEAFRTTLWLNHDAMPGSEQADAMPGSEQAEERRDARESTDNVGHVESARTDN